MVRTGVLVQVNQVVRVNLDLAVGQTTEKVTVSAAPPPIATDDASISEVLSQETVANLPLNGRDVLRAAALTPGVLTGFKSRTGLNSSGGQDFIGAGVHFCATCDGAFYRGDEVLVIGGGNSAGEEEPGVSSTAQERYSEPSAVRTRR